MNTESTSQLRLDNGLVVLCEEMPWLESAAVSISLPAGCQHDPTGKSGLAGMTSEMVQRGCGQRTSREFLEALEWLGVDDSSSVSVYFTQFSASMPATALLEAFGIFADLVRRPLLPADQLEEARMVCHQEVRSIEDDLSHKVMLELKSLYYGDPLGRNATGTAESIDALTLDDVQNFVRNHYHPQGAIISVAGKIEAAQVFSVVEKWFGDWQPQQPPVPTETPGPGGVRQLEFESQQTHIALAFDSVPYRHEDYFLARAAVGALSGGMSSRLFSEVREKRGLCYTVNASLHSALDRGSVIGYAGTSGDRAQETLDVMLDQFHQLNSGISTEELARVKVQVRSALVMQQESSRARAGSNAGDWFHLQRCRSRDEISEKVEALTVEQVNEFLARQPFDNFCLTTLGPSPLEVPHGISS